MDKVYIDCIYYGFWIDKSELHKYNLTEEYVNEKTKQIYINKTINIPINRPINRPMNEFTDVNNKEELNNNDLLSTVSKINLYLYKISNKLNDYKNKCSVTYLQNMSEHLFSSIQ